MAQPTSIVLGHTSLTVPGTPFRILNLGDSITIGVGFGPWFTTFAPAVEAAQIAAGAGGTVPPGILQTTARPTASHVWFNSGVAGDDCTCYLLDTIAVRVAAYQPDAVFINSDINCAQHKTGAPSRSGINTSDAVCTANHATILSQIAVQCPTAVTAWISSFSWFEQHPVGTNAGDTNLDTKIAITDAACTTAGVLHISYRSAFFAYEVIHNPSNVVSGILTSDGIHPNATGIDFERDNILPYIRYL